MVEKLRAIVGIALLCGAGYRYFTVPDSTNGEAFWSDRTSSGAIEYFASEDGKDYVGLYADRIEARSSFSAEIARALHIQPDSDGVVSIPLSRVKSVRRTLNTIRIKSDEGAWIEFHLTGLTGNGSARRFAQKVEELSQKESVDSSSDGP
jgi:hypothetical protein